MTPHVFDELQLMLDGRLEAAEIARVDAHLVECESCRRAARELAGIKAAVRRLPAPALPDGLADRVSSALRNENRRPPGTATRRAVVAGLAAAAVLMLAVWLWPEHSIVAEASRHASRADSGALALDLATPDPAALEQHFAARGRPVRVLDLAMMNLTLTGGSVVSVDGRPAALYLYRRSDGARLVCLMFPGRLEELPPPRTTIEHNGFQFQVYRSGRRTLVFWAEGELLCVLSAELPESEVIELAKAKAMRPT